MCLASRRGDDHRACPGQAHCLGFRSIGRALVKYMQRVLVTEQTLCGDNRLQATATTVRYTRWTGMLSSCMGQHSRFLVKSCLFWLLPSNQPMLNPKPMAGISVMDRIVNMGRSFGCSLWLNHILGASLFLSSRRYGERLYDAGLKARFQKGLCRLYTARWSRALSFATKSTYLLGRRIANLRPALLRGMRPKEV